MGTQRNKAEEGGTNMNRPALTELDSVLTVKIGGGGH